MPKFEHDCTGCKFLGEYRGCDLYVCEPGPEGQDRHPTVIARFGNEGGEYASFKADPRTTSELFKKVWDGEPVGTYTPMMAEAWARYLRTKEDLSVWVVTRDDRLGWRATSAVRWSNGVFQPGCIGVMIGSEDLIVRADKVFLHASDAIREALLQEAQELAPRLIRFQDGFRDSFKDADVDLYAAEPALALQAAAEFIKGRR